MNESAAHERLTPPHSPPMAASDEATAEQLDLARAQGESYVQAFEHMAGEVANGGGTAHAGDYIVGYAHEEAEGMYRREGGELVWQEPDGNIHIEVSVRDAGDNRFVPGLDVTLTLLDSDGSEVGTERMPFLWHPWLHHYGRNWTIPGDGTYTLRVRVAPPEFMRHDEKNGKRYADEVVVEFPGVELETGVED
ncbi:MAG: iron transporter [Gemmatimonadota bacterium]